MYIPKTKPYEHQTIALLDSWDREHFAFLMEMGTGKSKVIIDNIGMLAYNKGVTGVLILAPKGVVPTWVDEQLPTHLGLPHRLFVWGGPKKVERAAEFTRSRGGLKIMIMNTEALSSGDKAVDAAEAFLRSQRGVMIVDESTQIKSPRASRTRAAIHLGKVAAYRRILTGMPVTRSPLDVWSQFEFLKPGLLGFKSFFAFRARYAVMEQRWFGTRSIKLICGYQNEEELQKKIAPHSYRVLKDDCLDLPPKVYQTRAVEMTDEQRRVYESIREDATVQLESGDHVTATEVITQLLRMHQIVCGHTVDEVGQHHALPENRTAALGQIMEEVGGQAVIWSAFRTDIPRIVKELEDLGKVVTYYGETSQEGRADAVKKFQSGEARFFVGTPHTGGFGINLTASPTVIYYSNSHSLEHRMQSEDRCHRIGQKASKVTYIDLVTPGTVDEKIIAALRRKIDIASAITGDGYREWLV